MREIKVYALKNMKGYELMYRLDEKEIPYEFVEPTAEWVGSHKIKSLPVMQVDGKILDYRKAIKWIKKYKGVN